MLLTEATVTPTIPVTDIKRARRFYESTLGLKVVMEDSSPALMLEGGWGSMVYLYQRPPFETDHTVVTFTVHDIEGVVKELKGRGVIFEHYDLPERGIKTENDIASTSGMIYKKAAWFKDSEGNLIALDQLAESTLKVAREMRAAAAKSK
jgi:catechol 2,3-dioxygenase-like lactoylglutathione lyase family enzyme